LPQEAQGIVLPLDITYATLRTYFERARIAAKLPHVRFHDLRHTYASWLVQSGIGLTAVRDLLGHANLAVTGRYAHLATGHLMDAAKAAGAKMATGQKRGRPPAKPA
jgi:site-specific recombinase XerD